VRRAVFQETVVVGVRAFAPPVFGVVAGLLGKQRALLRLEINRPVAVGVTLGIVEDVHEYDIMPAPPAPSSAARCTVGERECP
jgi:hypothetical protein